MKLGEVLKEARLGQSLTQMQIAERIATSSAYYSRIESGKVKPPSWYLIDKLAVLLDLDKDYLVKLAEAALIEYKQKSLNKERKSLGVKPYSESRPIPILSDIPAGNPKDYTDLDYPPGIADDYYEFKVDDPNAFFLRAEGDCMSPEIKDGDLLLIYPNDKVESGDIAIISNDKDEKEVRRINIQPDQIILMCDNPAYPAIVWRNDKDKPKIIGRVKEIIRRR